MGLEERKSKEKEIRRTDMIEAAERVFFTRGYNQATMDDVAKEAEFSKRTLYAYFNSKEQLYFEIMIRGYKKLKIMLEEDLNKESLTGARARIKQMSATLYRFYLKEWNYFSAIMDYENREEDFVKGLPDTSREECYAVGEDILGLLIDILKDGIAEGAFRGDLDIKKTALVLWSCTIGVFNTARKKENYLIHFHKTTAEELIQEATNVILQGIKQL